MPRSLLQPFMLVLGASALQCSTPAVVTPSIEGCAKHETVESLDDYASTNRVKTDAKAGPVWTQPAPASGGMDFPSAMPVQFRWQPSVSDPGSEDGNVTCVHGPDESLRAQGSLHPLHEEMISGMAYDLQFSIGDKLAYRVVTSRQYADVPQSTWSNWAGESVQANLISVKLLNNDVADGPYRGTSMLTFQVKP